MPEAKKASIELVHTKRKRKEEAQDIPKLLTKRRRTLECDLEIAGFEKLSKKDSISVSATPGQESIYSNIFSAIYSTQPKNEYLIVALNDAELDEDQILQIKSVYYASQEFKEKYKHTKKEGRSYIEQKLLKKARYNVLRIKFLFPRIDFESFKDQKPKCEEQKYVFDNSIDKKNNFSWIKVR